MNNCLVLKASTIYLNSDSFLKNNAKEEGDAGGNSKLGGPACCHSYVFGCATDWVF
jgi:hypothetical protein